MNVLHIVTQRKCRRVKNDQCLYLPDYKITSIVLYNGRRIYVYINEIHVNILENVIRLYI